MKKEIFFFLLLLIFANIFAQKKEELFNGEIKDSIVLTKNAHITNLRTKKGASTSEVGKFEIYASIGDSLKITSIQHKTHYRIITKYDLISKSISVTLTLNRHQLDEIIIKKNNLSGNLLLDMKRKKEGRKEINAITLKLPNAGKKKMSQIDRKIYTASSSSSGVSLDLLLNLLSGRIKKLKEEKKVVDENNDVEYMLEKVKHFLWSDFNIKEEHQYRFLYYCRSDSLFSKNTLKNELNLIEFLQKKSMEFNLTHKNNLIKGNEK